MNLMRKLGHGAGYIALTPVIVFVMLMAVLLFVAIYEEPNDG
jgi:hypothetical protein